jgi:YVTN family beta-propeller protein
MADDDRPLPGRTEGTEAVHIRTFLIADVRGYTLFTQERGDEAATKLAARFADVAREVVNEHGGLVIELRGDEALAVFNSTRQAILAASQAQDRFLEETIADPSFPLPVGIGLDAGEAVPLGAGFRGGALNLAARLCGRAGPGEILASQGVVHLARKVEGVRYVDGGDLHLKGLAEPVRVFRAISEERDPAVEFRRLAPKRPANVPAPIRVARRHPVAAIVVALALVAAAALPTTIAVRGGGSGDLIAGDAEALIDLESGDLIGKVPLDSRPGAVAIGEGSVWATLPDRGAVVEIDPVRRAVVDTIPNVGADPVGIAVGFGSVWVANGGSSTVLQISPGASNAIVHTIDVGNGPSAIATGSDVVWVANSLDDSVSLIDPRDGELMETVSVGDQPVALAVDDTGVWVANAGSGTVSHVTAGPDPAVQQFQAGNGPGAIAVGAGAVWVANSLDDTVNRIDPETGGIDETIPVGANPGGVAVSGGSVWVTSASDGSIRKIAVPGSEPVTMTPLGGQAGDLAVGGAGLWVSVRGPTSAHRGGTLTVLVDENVWDSIDPALAYIDTSWSVQTLVGDGLLGYRRAGGVAGATLIPDLATTIPNPTDVGTTYTFQLRSGIRYSTGNPVMPEDFRRAIERLFEVTDSEGFLSGGYVYFTAIAGADDCLPISIHCDLSRGIVADDDARTVTFHLDHPDPDFPYGLTLPFAFPVPAATPGTESKTPLPGTGPYRIERYVPGKEIVLVRNPEFVPTDARPDGFPNRIVWELGPRGEQVDLVLGGEADLLYTAPPTGRLPELTTAYAGQLHLDPWAHTGYMFLNVRTPPFDDPLVRRALNFAVDRQAIVDRAFGARAVVACQILPPVLPGRVPYCPYTSDPDGAWTGPDMTRAKRLVRQSGTAGSKVTVWATSPRPLSAVPVGEAFVSLLGRLGYRAHLRHVSGETFFAAVEDPSAVQMAYEAWSADFPAETGFIPDVLACEGTFNLGGFCDHDIDSRMARAVRVSASDPHESHVLWSGIEHDLVDEAPWVPLINARKVILVSQRLGNYQFSATWGPLVDQMWVR